MITHKHLHTASSIEQVRGRKVRMRGRAKWEAGVRRESVKRSRWWRVRGTRLCSVKWRSNCSMSSASSPLKKSQILHLSPTHTHWSLFKTPFCWGKTPRALSAFLYMCVRCYCQTLSMRIWLVYSTVCFFVYCSSPSRHWLSWKYYKQSCFMRSKVLWVPQSERI